MHSAGFESAIAALARPQGSAFIARRVMIIVTGRQFHSIQCSLLHVSQAKPGASSFGQICWTLASNNFKKTAGVTFQHAVAQFVDALRYKPERHGLDSPMVSLEFIIDTILPASGIESASNRNE